MIREILYLGGGENIVCQYTLTDLCCQWLYVISRAGAGGYGKEMGLCCWNTNMNFRTDVYSVSIYVCTRICIMT